MTATADNGWELSVTRHIAAPPEKVWQVTPGQRFVFTDAVSKANGKWMPQTTSMIGGMEISPENGGTRYCTRTQRHHAHHAILFPL